MKKVWEPLGREGGYERIHLIVFRKPFWIYFSLRTRWGWDRSVWKLS